jgi:hypothetical protein
MSNDKSLKEILTHLCELSVERAYDPHSEFEWPESLPEDVYWMSPELLSVHGTEQMKELTHEQLVKLSHCELVNFFSFNVHGIRDLMLQVLSCIHNSGYEIESDYFHHFLDEENKHMWFFAEFCKLYGKKIYVTQKVQFPSFEQADIQSFVAFAKILITEQIGDFYNVRMMGDQSLPPIVQKLNRVHHDDESRHIAMGRRVVSELYDRIVGKYPEETHRQIESYVRRYTEFVVQSFYNPAVYRDAGLEKPYEWRRTLINNPARTAFHQDVLRPTLQYFRRRAMHLDEALS